MSTPVSIFLDFNLPNATTWFYFSALLAMALFFKFSRLLSVRNLDVLSLFLLVPGLLLLTESRGNWYGYLWLLSGSFYFLVRCVVDLALVRRPSLGCNLNSAGLGWLAFTLFVCLIAVAVRRPSDRNEIGAANSAPVAIDTAQKQGQNLVQQRTAAGRSEDFDAEFWVERTLALVCHLSIVVGILVIGWRHFQDVHAGMAAATFYLILPYTALHIGQWHHVWPMALMVWAVAAYRKPALSGLLLGLAAGTVYFPFLTLPAWLSFYWKRGIGRFAGAFALSSGLCLAAIGLVLWMAGELPDSLRSALSLSGWQAWREPNTEGFWTGIHWGYRLPVFIAYVAFLMLTVFWPAPKNLAHLLALSAALLIGIQFWYAEQGGVYVLWYLPLLLLVVFRPNLSDRRPPVINPETDWLFRLSRALGRLALRILRPPEPVARVR